MSDTTMQQIPWLQSKKARKLMLEAWAEEAKLREKEQRRLAKEVSLRELRKTDDKPTLEVGDFMPSHLRQFHVALATHLSLMARDTHVRGAGVYTIPSVPTDVVAHMLEGLAASHKRLGEYYEARLNSVMKEQAEHHVA